MVGEGRAPAAALAAAALAAALSLGPAGPARAQPPEALLAACAACHGSAGNATVPQFPSLAGQPKVFIENQLVLIREGLRDIPVMKDVMKGLGDEQIIALAVHYAAQRPQPLALTPEPAKLSQGAAISRQRLCGTCHLANYAGQQQVPRLAGQNEPYLLHSMQQFRDHPGPGRDTIMAATLRGLGDGELASLAHYLASAMP